MKHRNGYVFIFILICFYAKEKKGVFVKGRGRGLQEKI